MAQACRRDTAFQPPPGLWKPGIYLVNGIGEEQLLVSDAPRIDIEDSAEGRLSMWMTFCGEVDNPMALQGFPFDEDSIDFRLCGCRMRNGTSATAADFLLWAKGGPDFAEFNFESHLAEFQLLGISFLEYTKWGLSFLTFSISIRRRHRYYFYKVTMLMWLIVLLTMPTFLFGYHELEARTSLVSTMFLATAATLIVVAQDLPKTNRLHLMDLLLLGTLLFIFVAGAESIAVSLLAERGELEWAEDLEIATVIGLSAAYALLNAALFVRPVIEQWRRGSQPHPSRLRQERVFVPWAQVRKADPWCAGDDAEIRTQKPSFRMRAVDEVENQALVSAAAGVELARRGTGLLHREKQAGAAAV